jgi:hypothetical protein
MTDWQLISVVLLVAFAAGYVAWKSWRTWRPPKGGCGGSCGCARQTPAAETPRSHNLIPADQLTLRRHSPES